MYPYSKKLKLLLLEMAFYAIIRSSQADKVKTEDSESFEFLLNQLLQKLIPAQLFNQFYIIYQQKIKKNVQVMRKKLFIFLLIFTVFIFVVSLKEKRDTISTVIRYLSF